MSDGEIHIWLPIQEFLSGEVYFLEADPNVTLTEPGTGQLAMTAAYYNGTDNGVDIHSGRGYTRNGRTTVSYTHLDVYKRQMYEIPKDDNIGQVTITRAYIEGTGGPIISLRGQEVQQIEQKNG